VLGVLKVRVFLCFGCILSPGLSEMQLLIELLFFIYRVVVKFVYRVVKFAYRVVEFCASSYYSLFNQHCRDLFFEL